MAPVHRFAAREENELTPVERGGSPEGVSVRHGRFRLVVPYAVIALALGAVGSWYATSRAARAPDATQSEAYAQVVHKLEQAEAQRSQDVQTQAVVNAAVLSRLNTLETGMGELRATNTAILLAVRRER